MSTRRFRREIIFVCDGCGDELPSESDGFALAWAMAKRNGWIAQTGRDRTTGEDEWRHFCETCA